MVPQRYVDRRIIGLDRIPLIVLKVFLRSQGWMFTDFSTAFSIAAAYLAFVFIGSAIMWAGKCTKAGNFYPASSRSYSSFYHRCPRY